MSSSAQDVANPPSGTSSSIANTGGGTITQQNLPPDSSTNKLQSQTQQATQQIAVQQKSGTATFPINLASAKIAHVKSTTIDAIKVTPTVVPSSGQQTATFRTISGGPTPQVRLVMPISQQAMIKQIDGSGNVRAQITAIPARTLSQTSITVTRPVTPTTYIPRAGVTATTNLQAQRLTAPLRAPTPPGNFVRSTTAGRSTNSPATTVISPTNATWMAATGGTAQVQLIRAINHNPRQRLIPQNITANTTTSGQTMSVGQTGSQNQQNVGQPNQSNIQTSQQQTFVATVLPRQQTATLVYSNVNPQQQSGQQTQQQFTPNVVSGSSNTAPQRITVAAAALSSAGNQRQMRPIQLTNRTFTTTKLSVGGMNTTNLSIRSPNINQIITSTLNAATSIGGTNSGTATATATLQGRPTTAGNLSGTNLSTTRIIQLQQTGQGTTSTGTTTQQIIGPSGRITSNLMLQPIIMNTGGKIGVRPPANVATKVQPSLTITQLGLGKLTAANAQQVQGAISSQSVVPSSAVSVSTIAQPTSQTVTVNVSQQQPITNVSQQQPITQIVNVNQQQLSTAGHQQIITQNIPSSATVVPLSISSKGNNVFTGTITPIKASTAGPITKVISQQSTSNQQHPISEIMASTSQGNQPQGNVFIHTARSTGGTGNVVVNSANSANAFLPAGGTFYYESVPGGQVSTGVLSLTTTTITSSNTQTVTSSNLGTGIVTAIPYAAGGTFTVVPSNSNTTNGNRIGQIQIPVSSATGNQITNLNQVQTVPIRFNPQQITASNPTTDHSSTVTGTGQAQSNNSMQTQPHQMITIPPQSQIPQFTVANNNASSIQSTGHMANPIPTAIKLPPGTTASPSPSRSQQQQQPSNNNVNITAFPTRKRDNDGSPIRVAKNLQSTFLSMTNTISAVAAGAGGNQAIQLNTNQLNTLITGQQRNKINNNTTESRRAISPVPRPASSDGSTTVSANSSPGLDQQINEELAPMNRIGSESHFNPITDMYSNHQNPIPTSMIRRQPEHPISFQNTTSTNGSLDCTPRKKIRRSTNDSQNSTASQHQQQHQNLFPQQQNNNPNYCNSTSSTSNNNLQETNKPTNNVVHNKENAKPTEFIIKKPRTNILDTYKQSWKALNNHFQRYSDVKPREERRPTVMDIANQSNVIEKINGWKVHHLGSQMEDLCETEGQVYEKLSEMLKNIEINGNNPEIDRVSELIKGNMQRSKIIADGVNDARLQIMKIFDHKSKVKEIIHRSASKRNLKKREKS